MLAGQAIGNSVMDLMANLGVKASNNSESSVAKTKDSVSFNKLLSQKTYQRDAKDYEDSLKPTTSDTFRSKSTKAVDHVEQMKSNQVKSNQFNPCDTESEVSDKADAVAMVINEVKESIMDTLDITEEELLSMMEMLGLGMVDLLNPDTLKLLVLNQAGTTEPLKLLTEDGLGQQLNQLLTKLNDMMKDSNLATEDIANLCKDPTNFNKLISLLDETTTTVPQQEIVIEQEELQMEDNQESKQVAKESDIQFTVVREESNSVKETELSSSFSSTTSDQEEQQGSFKSESTMANQFIDQMMNASSIVNDSDFSINLREIHELREVANQIIDQIKLTIKPSQTTMEFTLNPENLGKVGLNITSKNGILTASFTTQNEIAKEAIESQMHVLKDNLANQGIKVEAIEVTVSDFGFQQESKMSQEGNQQNNHSSNSKRVFRMDGIDDLVEATQDIADSIFNDSGSNIDYSA